MSGRGLLSGRYKLLTFDCYGTLINWDNGIRGALGALMERAGVSASAEQVYGAYIETEAGLEKPPWRPYAQILEEVVSRLGQRFGFGVDHRTRRVLTESLPSWKPFDDTNEALARLKRKYELGILSNIDRDLIARTREGFDVRFDWVVTAEDVRAYKPAHDHFQRILECTGYGKDEVLHVAQSVFHDIVPACSLGFSCAWINRRNETNDTDATPTAEFGDLKSLADALGV